jgi:hypothetical protein
MNENSDHLEVILVQRFLTGGPWRGSRAGVGNSQAVAQSVNPIQIHNKNVILTILFHIHFSKWIDNPIQIQSQSNYFGKDLG